MHMGLSAAVCGRQHKPSVPGSLRICCSSAEASSSGPGFQECVDCGSEVVGSPRQGPHEPLGVDGDHGEADVRNIEQLGDGEPMVPVLEFDELAVPIRCPCQVRNIISLS